MNRILSSGIDYKFGVIYGYTPILVGDALSSQSWTRILLFSGLLAVLIFIIAFRLQVKPRFKCSSFRKIIGNTQLKFQSYLNTTRWKLQEKYMAGKDLIPGVKVFRPKPNRSYLQHYFIRKVYRKILEHLDEPDFNVTALSHSMGISTSHLYRKIKVHTGMTTSRFIRYVRLQKALELLAENRYSITSIAMDVGFDDPGYFSRVFKQEFGMSPGKWREEYEQANSK